MDKLEEFIRQCDERKIRHELAMAEILEQRAKEREERRANLARMRAVDTMVSKVKMPFISVPTAQTKRDRESIHDDAQHNPTLLRILRKMRR